MTRIGASLILFFSFLPLWAAEAPPPPVLPAQFAGWRLMGSVVKSADPAAADGTNAVVLQEYGFQRLEEAIYTRDDGRQVAVKAAVFADATGAYGAFTYYKTPAMAEEKIGVQGCSFNNRVLFYQGNILVDAVFDRISVMSAAELRELAGLLPKPGGNAGNLPSLQNYLPRQFDLKNAKYILGPAALDRVGSPLPSSKVGFDSGAEVVIATGKVTAGDATLMLISYPTPQIAAEKLRQIDAAHETTQQPGTTPILDIGPFFDKRTGPIVVIAAGPLSLREAKALLASISYEADLTWNENTYFSKKDNVASFLFNAILLCIVVVGLALVAGIAFFGVRVVTKRLLPGRVFDRPENFEIITLHLDENLEVAPRQR
jgi:hypothetical protein